MAMVWVEVEDVDGAESGGLGADAAGGDGRGVPVLVLEVDFDGEVMGEVVVEADAGGEDEGVGVEVAEVAEDVAAPEVVDCAATDEEVGVGVEAAEGVLDLGAEEEVFLAADGAFVDGIRAADLGGGPEAAEGEDRDVGAGGDVEVFSACEVGKGAGGSGEGGELKLLGCGGGALCECVGGREGQGKRCNQDQPGQ